MTVRTTGAPITFAAPFHLPGFDELPAGTYEVETDEQAFESSAGLVYRRVATSLRIPCGSGYEYHLVDPKCLEEALRHDRRPTPGAGEIALEPATWRWVPLWVRSSRATGGG